MVCMPDGRFYLASIGRAIFAAHMHDIPEALAIGFHAYILAKHTALAIRLDE